MRGCRGSPSAETGDQRVNKELEIFPLLPRSQSSDTKPPGLPCTFVWVVSRTRVPSQECEKGPTSNPYSGHQPVCCGMICVRPECRHLLLYTKCCPLPRLWSCVCTEWTPVSNSQKDQTGEGDLGTPELDIVSLGAKRIYY